MLRASHALSATMLALLAAVAAPAHAVPIASFTGSAGAITVTGSATDLSAPGAAADLWRFSLAVTGQMGTGDNLQLVLPSSIYTNVSNLTGPANYGLAYNTAGLTPFFSITDNGSTATSSTFTFTTAMVPTITATTLKQLNLQLIPSGGAGSLVQLDFNMTPQTAAPVPEPATYGLMALGLLAIGLRRRSRKD